MAQTDNKTIIFMETKKKVDDITRKLKNSGYDDFFRVKKNTVR